MVLPPVRAAAILILPSLVTNVWQMLAGPALTVVVHRVWPMLLAVCLGTWAGLGLMTGATARFGTELLGVALVLYTMTGLIAFRPSAPKLWEPILSPVVGAITGLTTAATGVFVIPAVPYLQAIGFEKEELVQALGLSFTVSTMALAFNVAFEGGLQFRWRAIASWRRRLPAWECGSGKRSDYGCPRPHFNGGSLRVCCCSESI